MTSTVISSLGSYAFNFAFMAYIFDISNHNKSYMGLTQLFFVTGMLLGNILAGPIGEKNNRKTILVFCEILRIPISIIFILTQNIWALLFCHGLKTIFAGISTPAKRAFINDIVDKENISRANNIFSASFAVIQITGPLLGTWAYSQYKSITQVAIFDISTFVIAPLLLLMISIPKFTKSEHSNFIRDIKSGLEYIKNRLDLRGLYERHAYVGVFSGLVIPLILPFMHDVLGKGEKEYGIAMVVFGLGGITGAIFNKKIVEKIGIAKVLFYTSAIEPFFLLVWALAFNYYICQFIFFVWGALFFIRIPCQFSYLSHHVDKSYITRTNAVLDFIFTLTNISASAFIVISGSQVATKTFLVAVSLSYILITILRINSKSTKVMLSYSTDKELENA